MLVNTDLRRLLSRERIMHDRDWVWSWCSEVPELLTLYEYIFTAADIDSDCRKNDKPGQVSKSSSHLGRELTKQERKM